MVLRESIDSKRARYDSWRAGGGKDPALESAWDLHSQWTKLPELEELLRASENFIAAIRNAPCGNAEILGDGPIYFGFRRPSDFGPKSPDFTFEFSFTVGLRTREEVSDRPCEEVHAEDNCDRQPGEVDNQVLE